MPSSSSHFVSTSRKRHFSSEKARRSDVWLVSKGGNHHRLETNLRRYSGLSKGNSLDIKVGCSNVHLNVPRRLARVGTQYKHAAQQPRPQFQTDKGYRTWLKQERTVLCPSGTYNPNFNVLTTRGQYKCVLSRCRMKIIQTHVPLGGVRGMVVLLLRLPDSICELIRRITSVRSSICCSKPPVLKLQSNYCLRCERH